MHADSHATATVLARLRLGTGADTACFDLAEGSNTLGRSPDSTIHLDDPSVSQRHCEIQLTPGGAFLRDLGSTNGTFVDGQPIQQAILTSGQRVRVGSVELLFEIEAPEATCTLPTENAAAPAIVAHSTAGGPCSNHPKSQAVWCCTGCCRLLCALCIQHVRLDAGKTVTLCKVCKGVCERVEQPGVPANATFRSGLLSALAYPFQGNGPYIILGATLVEVAISFLGPFGLIFGLAMSVYILALLREIVLSSSQGDSTMPDWPDFAWDTLFPAWLQFTAVTLICLSPATLCRIWLAPDLPSFKILSEVVFLGGAVYFPMALLGVFSYDSLAGLNPMLVFLSIAKVPFQYAGLCLFLGAMAVLNLLLGLFLQHLPMARLSSAMVSLASLYSMVVAMRALGWFYYCSKERLEWH
jgi:hypothetical protein